MPSTYDQDFFQWTQETAAAIEAGRFDKIDRAALADEVDSLGKRDRREGGSRMVIILTHMLKTKYQPEMETPSWRNTIREHRDELTGVLADSPSLRVQLDDLLPSLYKRACRKAAAETGLEVATFPVCCPWTVEEVLGDAVADEGK
jgi:uncharacterized protein DUF29